MRPTGFVRPLTKLRAQRNATESPLLRLPAELRHRTWTFAVKVDRIFVPTAYCWVVRQHVVRKGGAVALEENGEIASRHPESSWTSCCPVRQRGAFHLPEVCRQIYIETATLAYSSNIFLVDSDSLSCQNWARKKISLAQRDAIVRVEMDYGALFKQLFGVPASLRLRGFRNLTHIHVPLRMQHEQVLKHLSIYPALYDLDLAEEYPTICEAKLKEIDGSDIEVVFEDDDAAAEVSDLDD
jgi:hypothetical protein